jgi:hypothetical protein
VFVRFVLMASCQELMADRLSYILLIKVKGAFYGRNYGC